MSKDKIDPEEKKWEAHINEMVLEFQGFAKKQMHQRFVTDGDAEQVAVAQSLIFAGCSILIGISEEPRPAMQVGQTFVQLFFASLIDEENNDNEDKDDEENTDNTDEEGEGKPDEESGET